MNITCIQLACIKAPCGSICTNENGNIVNPDGSPVLGLKPGATANTNQIFGGTNASLPPELRGNQPNHRGASSNEDEGMSIGTKVMLAAAFIFIVYLFFSPKNPTL